MRLPLRCLKTVKNATIGRVFNFGVRILRRHYITKAPLTTSVKTHCNYSNYLYKVFKLHVYLFSFTSFPLHHIEPFSNQFSLRSRRKRGRGERTRKKNGVLGARDEGTRSLVPSLQSPIFLRVLAPPPLSRLRLLRRLNQFQIIVRRTDSNFHF